MAFNDLMHPRNIYCKPPDFEDLATRFPDFANFVVKRGSKSRIDFRDPYALRSLTSTLLKNDFNLAVEIPDNCLIPTVPQRLNYILWIEDLLSKIKSNQDVIKGIDIGTGPCCIFPLLGAKKNGWHFVATEIVEESFKYAQKNVQANSLQDQISVKKVKGEMMIHELVTDLDRYDFCMCNPPFFQNFEELHRKKKLPHDAMREEVIVDGGEVAFVKKIVEESVLLKDQIRIYSSMLGRKQSLQQLVKLLKPIENIKYTTAEFGQGNTMRWGIAWTFLPVSDFSVVYPKKPKVKTSVFSFIIPQAKIADLHCFKDVLERTKAVLNEFQILHDTRDLTDSHAHLSITAYENTWTHQRRKRREKQRTEKKHSETDFCEKKDTSKIDVSENGKTREESASDSAVCPLNNLNPNGDCNSEEHPNKYRRTEGGKISPIETSVANNSSLSDKNNMKELILNCSIFMDKYDNDIYVQFSRKYPSNPQTMHEIYFLLKGRLS